MIDKTIHYATFVLLLTVSSALRAQKMEVTCPHCNHTFIVAVDADPSATDPASETPATEADFAQEEQAILAELNFARTEPKRYADEVLVPYLNDFNTDGMSYIYNGMVYTTSEGRSAVREAIRVMQTSRPVGALTALDALHLAAYGHTCDIGPRGLTDHKGSNGKTPAQRILSCYPASTSSGECLSFGFYKARIIVRELIVDDGVPSRGHRENIMNPRYTHVGASIGTHTQYDYMCTIDFSN